jgi:short-subunit dehydrogenase
MKLNCLPIAILSKIFIQKFQKRSFPSAIINLSSGSMVSTFTGCCHYASTKLFIDYLSRALEN